MAGWAVSFLAVGLVLLPGVVIFTGKPFSSLSAMDKTGVALLNQAITTALGVLIVRLPAKKYGQMPEDLFRYSLRCASKRFVLRVEPSPLGATR